MADRLCLLACEPGDVPLLSALCQDALTSRGAIHWSARARRLVLMLDRYRWEAASMNQRVRAALAIRGVERVRSRGLDQVELGLPLVLLSLRFEPAEEPAGRITLSFAGPGETAISLDVEAVDLMLEDVSAPRGAQARPDHD